MTPWAKLNQEDLPFNMPVFLLRHFHPSNHLAASVSLSLSGVRLHLSPATGWTSSTSPRILQLVQEVQPKDLLCAPHYHLLTPDNPEDSSSISISWLCSTASLQTPEVSIWSPQELLQHISVVKSTRAPCSVLLSLQINCVWSVPAHGEPRGSLVSDSCCGRSCIMTFEFLQAVL